MVHDWRAVAIGDGDMAELDHSLCHDQESCAGRIADAGRLVQKVVHALDGGQAHLRFGDRPTRLWMGLAWLQTQLAHRDWNQRIKKQRRAGDNADDEGQRSIAFADIERTMVSDKLTAADHIWCRVDRVNRLISIFSAISMTSSTSLPK